MPGTTQHRKIGTLLVLGADGDLSNRLLLPGLATLLASDWRPDRSLLLLGAGLKDLSAAAWHRRVRDAFATAGVRGRRVTDTARLSRYHTTDVTNTDDLTRLLAECEGAPAIYFALPPSVTARVCQSLRVVDLPPGTVLAMEKPFGTDLASARELNELVAALVPEEQVFRVDHFLGRSDVLNILGVRFANRLLEPVWSTNHVERIEIVYDESLALEGRAGYYDHAGALVDMIQSHLLQVMALLMMDRSAASTSAPSGTRRPTCCAPPGCTGVRAPRRGVPGTPAASSATAGSPPTHARRVWIRLAGPRPSPSSRWRSATGGGPVSPWCSAPARRSAVRARTRW